MKYFLGIDTSCYTTSCALVDENGRLISEHRKLLEVRHGKKGLQQSQMVFQHTRALSTLLESIPLHGEISAIGVSAWPRRDENSYMPAFLVGLHHGKSLAHFLKVPCYEFSHQENHIWACLREIGEVPEDPFLSLHLSGGTTEILLCKRQKGSGFHTTLLSSANDIAAGQLVDRLGVLMGLPFPAGVHMERLSKTIKGEITSILPVSVQNGSISFGGPYSAGMRWWTSQEELGNDTTELIENPNASILAKSVFQCIGESLERSLSHIVKEHDVSTLITAGGVMANRYLQNRLIKWGHAHNLDVLCTSPKYSADNASGNAFGAMIVKGEQ